jgi:hypothetical protein
MSKSPKTPRETPSVAAAFSVAQWSPKTEPAPHEAASGAPASPAGETK